MTDNTAQSLAEWFLSIEIDLQKGFRFDANRKISDPSIFIKRLRGEAQDLIDGNCPRNRYGAVEKDLLLLQDYVGQLTDEKGGN